MNAEDLTLNIAVNLGRVSRFASEGREKRVEQFLADTESYIDRLKKAPKSNRFDQTFKRFQEEFLSLTRSYPQANHQEWADQALTWSNILTHRAKLA